MNNVLGAEAVSEVGVVVVGDGGFVSVGEFLAPEGCAWGSREEVVDYPALDAPGSKRGVEGSRGLSEEMCEFFKGRGVQ